MTTGRTNPFKPLNRLFHLTILVVYVISSFSFAHAAGTAQSAIMNYHDVTELNAALTTLANGSRHALLVTIGSSPDFKTNPQQPVVYTIYAIRISSSIDRPIEDDYRKNSILFEAGMHAREWLGPESLLSLANYLIFNAENQASGVPALLAKVDVWIIPLSNPAGRAIDDRHGGDPRFFSTTPISGGWRNNGDIRGGCVRGVNIARNFSVGWDDEPSKDCKTSNTDLNSYKGFAPFSTAEASALRRFVENHSISMAVAVHSNIQEIANLWKANDSAGNRTVDLAMFAWNAALDNSNLTFSTSGKGDGYGQFTAWLSGVSDVPCLPSPIGAHIPCEPDTGTQRNIQTFLIELPFIDTTNKTTYMGAYRAPQDNGGLDTSNGFHPSGSHVQDLIGNSFIPMAKVMIDAAASPGCHPTQAAGSCRTRDFGLMGAKIGKSPFGSGSLIIYSARCKSNLKDGECIGEVVPARDLLPIGTYSVFYRVQNFSTRAGYDDLDVQMIVNRTIRRPEGNITTTTKSIQPHANLGQWATAYNWFTLDIDQIDADYQVILEVRPTGGFSTNTHDVFQNNDVKIFKFTSK